MMASVGEGEFTMGGAVGRTFVSLFSRKSMDPLYIKNNEHSKGKYLDVFLSYCMAC